MPDALFCPDENCVRSRACAHPGDCLIETPDTVVAAVRGDLLSRSLVGIKKYGVPLSANPADEAARLQHAYEEALDLANYLKWSIMKLKGELA